MLTAGDQKAEGPRRPIQLSFQIGEDVRYVLGFVEEEDARVVGEEEVWIPSERIDLARGVEGQRLGGGLP